MSFNLTYRFILRALLMLVISHSAMNAAAQTNPTDTVPVDPGLMAVYHVQNMNFGAFSVGNAGGSVTIAPSGARSVSGDIVPLNLGVLACQAIFEVEAPEGVVISLFNGPAVTLTGSNGGSLQLTLGGSYPVSPFIITVPAPSRTAVNIGGTLTVGSPALNPPGSYTGNFYITFNQE